MSDHPIPPQADQDDPIPAIAEEIAQDADGEWMEWEQGEWRVNHGALKESIIKAMRALAASLRAEPPQAPSPKEALEALCRKWWMDAQAIHADGDYCCGKTREHDADELAAVLQAAEAPQAPGWMPDTVKILKWARTLTSCTCSVSSDVCDVHDGWFMEFTRAVEAMEKCKPEGKLPPPPADRKTLDCGCVMKLVESSYWVHENMCGLCHEHRNER